MPGRQSLGQTDLSPATTIEDVTTLNPDDLGELERVLLGVLGAGLVPSSIAADPSFRYDYLTAVSFALWQGLPRETYLEPDGTRATEVFQRQLSDAVYELEQRRVLVVSGPSPEVLLDPSAGASGGAVPARREAMANFDQEPAIFDRYLAGRCLDEILRNTAVYRFIMDKYADSSEIWQQHYKESNERRRF